jgi:hypothetical protein
MNAALRYTAVAYGNTSFLPPLVPLPVPHTHSGPPARPTAPRFYTLSIAR